MGGVASVASMPSTHPVARHCDVAIIGGSAAGLAAALQLARQRRSVIVVDSGEPRNAAAAHMHSFLGRDGTPPGDLLAAGRAEVRGYGGEILSGRAVDITRGGEGFVILLAAGHTVTARRVVAATGLADDLPTIEGLEQHWGGAVIQCPFCHGYEARDRRIVQVATHPMALHPAPLFRQLTDRFTLLLEPEVDFGTAAEPLRAADVDIRVASTRRLLSDTDGRLSGVELTDGTQLPADAVVVSPRFRARAEAFATLGVRSETHPSGLGDVLVVDAMGATAVDGVFAAGSITDPGQQVLPAAAHGSRVGAAVALSLADEDLRAGGRPFGSATDWEHRYSGEPLWSGNPNGALVAEVTGLAPGRALDVGAGEGGDAVWLAEQGWITTASDIAARALDRVRTEAEHRGVSVSCLLADANSLRPFPREAFDLVTASYASIPRTPDRRAVHTILDAVAPGGTLLVLSHDPEAMRSPQHHGVPFDPDAYLQVDDFIAVLAETPGWTIESQDKRPRPPGAATAEHHVDDVVLRARRV